MASIGCRSALSRIHIESIDAESEGQLTDLSAMLSHRKLGVARPSFRERLAKSAEAISRAPRDAATDIARLLAVAPDLSKELASANPYLGVRLLQLRSSWVSREFAENFARALVADPSSILYRELKRAENLDENSVPMVDAQEQPLLSAILDATSRNDQGLFYSFFDCAVAPLRAPTESLLSAINGPCGDYYERGRWTSSLFAAQYLLEVVAKRSSGAPDAPSLNLYGLATLTDLLLLHYKHDPRNEPREWPTPVHYLLYNCVSTLVDLVLISKPSFGSIDQEKESKASDSAETSLSGHAASVLGATMSSCLRSPELTTKFKSYLLEVWWRCYANKYRGTWSGSSYVLEAFARGGNFGRPPSWDDVQSALSDIDIVLRSSEPAEQMRKHFDILTVRGNK